MTWCEFIADREWDRLDVFLAAVTGQSRSYVQKLVREGYALQNGKVAKASSAVVTGDNILLHLPPPQETEALPEDIPLDVVYEDEDILVINKPRGMVVHPAPGNYTGTLVNAILAHCKDLKGINDRIRPGIVHRLDKDTTGLLVVAKNDSSMKGLIAQMKARTVSRRYLAIVEGVPASRGRIEAPIGRHPRDRKRMAVVPGGREAVTEYEVLETFRDNALIECFLHTGRTHQIRVHMAFIGHPVVGDQIYGRSRQRLDIPGQALHAHFLSFRHPVKGEPVEFTAVPPPDFEAVLRRLRAER